MISHKAEALRLIEIARAGVTNDLNAIDEYARRAIALALSMAADEVQAIEELKRPRRAKKETPDG